MQESRQVFADLAKTKEPEVYQGRTVKSYSPDSTLKTE